MMNVNLFFLLIAGIAFLGYVLMSLFYRIKIANVLPLMLIGLLLGPILKVVNTSQGSMIQTLVPYITALAIAFILFDVGMSINARDLSLVYASRFTFALSFATGLVLGVAIFLALHLSIALSFAAGFGLAGPSAVVIPSIIRSTRINPKLKATLNFESVVVDSVTMIIPIAIFEFIALKNLSLGGVASMLFGFFVGSFIIGGISAFFWVFVLKTFKRYSRQYSWMLTISMVIATYGIAQELGANGAMAVFIFGIFLANIPRINKWFNNYTKGIRNMFGHVSQYQREVTFFVSTFFFVYIGLLLQISTSDYVTLAASIGISIIIFYLRKIFLPLLKPILGNLENANPEQIVAQFSVARGLSPVVVATLPFLFGIYAPQSFISVLFFSVLFTNVITTLGMYKFAHAVTNEQNKTIVQMH